MDDGDKVATILGWKTSQKYKLAGGYCQKDMFFDETIRPVSDCSGNPCMGGTYGYK